MLLLDERIRSDGSTARLTAELEGAGVRLRDDDGTQGVLAVAALGAVMTRYGRLLEVGVLVELEAGGLSAGLSAAEGRCGWIDRLALPGGYALRRMRFHAIVDAEGRDYLVWEQPGQEPLAAIGTTVAAALRFLLARQPVANPTKI